MDVPQTPLPEKRKRNVFQDLRKNLLDVNVRATRGAIQSANFVEGSTGWRFSSNGLIEGTRLKLDNFVPYTDDTVSFSGSWTPESVVILYGGGRTVSSTVGDTFTITFTGSSIGLVMEKGADQGKIDIVIDGESITTVDLYSTVLSSRQVAYSITTLDPGEHTLVATVATKNPSASDNNVGLQGYVKSPTDGIRLEDISADLFAASFSTGTDGNGYAKGTSTGIPSGWVAWGIMGFLLSEADMSDATLTDPKLAVSTNAFYLYNGAASTSYVNTRIFLISKIA